MNKRECEQEVIDRIQKDQLQSKSNTVDMREMSNDPSSPNYSKVELDRPSDDAPKSDANPMPFAECSRFCIDHTDQLDEDAIRKNKKMSLNQDIDHI